MMPILSTRFSVFSLRQLPRLLAVGLLCLACVARADSPPNLVVIHVDDLGWADIGCYGSEYFRTPHIDGLAERGARFTQGYAAAAVCSPTRAALLTGRYPARIGITDWIRATFQGGEMPEDGQNPSGWIENPNYLRVRRQLANQLRDRLQEELQQMGARIPRQNPRWIGHAN